MRILRNPLPYYVLTISYAALIFYLSSRESVEGTGFDVISFDKAAHVVEYFILGFLLYLSIHFSNLDLQVFISRIPGKMERNAVPGILLGTLYGISDEVHQHFVPGRDMKVLDVVADAIGVVLGVILAIMILRQIGEIVPTLTTAETSASTVNTTAATSTASSTTTPKPEVTHGD